MNKAELSDNEKEEEDDFVSFTIPSRDTFAERQKKLGQMPRGSPSEKGVSQGESGKSSTVKPVTGGGESEALPVQQPRDVDPPADLQDDVFDYDPGFQEDPSQPLTDSDSEADDDDDGSSTTNDNSYNLDDDTERIGGTSSTQLFSTSVPINVPQFKTFRQQQQQQLQRHVEKDSNDTLNMKPDEMAASIQALARSVHADSAMVFGELPKSRTRTSRTLSTQGSVSSAGEK